MNDRNQLSKNIKKFRSLKGLTQSQLAEASGLSLVSIAQIEGGRRWPRQETLSLIAGALGVGANEIISGESIDPKSSALSFGDAVEILSKISSTSPERRAVVLAILYGDISLIKGVDLSKVSDLSQLVLKSR